MLPNVRELLLQIKLEQLHFNKEYGKQYHESDYCFTWQDGRLLRPDYVYKRFAKVLENNSLPKMRFHDLRHSSASLLVNMGFSLKEVQEWLGHSDIASTQIYSHLLYKSKENMAEKVNDALNF